MQLLLLIELALILLFLVKVGIRNIEQELQHRPSRYDTDCATEDARVYSPFILLHIAVPSG
jgi:hypothetical protein